MADAFTPVATQIKPPDPMQGINAYSGILGLQQQQQALQTNQIQQRALGAEADQAQQRNRELQAAQGLVFNGAKNGQYDDGEGGLDRQRLADDIIKVAPTYGQQISGQLLSQANEIVANKQAHQSLTLSQKKEMGDTFASLAADPEVDNTKFIDAVEKLRQAHKNDPDFSRMLTSMTTHYPGAASADQQRAILGRWSAAATGEPQVAPSTVATPGGTQGVTQNRFTGALDSSGGPVAAPPHQTTNAAGQIVNVTPAGAVSVAPPNGASGGTGGGAPTGANPTTAQASVQNEAARNAAANIEDARAIGDHAPAVRNVNDQLLQLSRQTSTGPGTQTVQKLAAAAGLPSGSRYQEITAYLDRQAALSARQMGVPNTNAGLAASQSATGTTEYTPRALQEKVKFADALNSGAMAYRQGLDRAVGIAATPDVGKYQAFRSAWARNFDPDVFRAEDAMRRGDREELAALRQRLGPQGMKMLAQKSANLRQLENGQIPQ